MTEWLTSILLNSQVNPEYLIEEKNILRIGALASKN